jgi:uncharacterized membrane protein YqjE
METAYLFPSLGFLLLALAVLVIFLVVPLMDAIVCRRIGWALVIFFFVPLGGMAWMLVGHRRSRRLDSGHPLMR